MKIKILIPVFNDWQSVSKLTEEINSLPINPEHICALKRGIAQGIGLQQQGQNTQKNRPEDDGVVGLARWSAGFQHRGLQALSQAAVRIHCLRPAGGLSSAGLPTCPSCHLRTARQHDHR